MRSCSSCHRDNLEHRRFCRACGTPLGGRPCDRCGFGNEVEDRYCGGCGQELANRAALAAEPPDGPPAAGPAGKVASRSDLQTVLNEVASEIKPPDKG